MTVVRWVTTAYQWAFVDSGFLDWVRRQYAHQMHSDNAVTREINSWSGWLAGHRLHLNRRSQECFSDE